MGKKQHFVPKVYMKAWKIEAINKNEPDKEFKGVFAFKKDEVIGNGVNVGSILWKPHLYTVGFNYLFITKSCPKILDFFINEIYKLMKYNKPNPVYGKYGYCIIKTKKSIRENLSDIEKWDFCYYDGSLARKTHILSCIRNMNCYILENAFDDIFEKRWENIYNRFIYDVHHGIPIALGQSERRISSDSVMNMLEFFFMMLCRNPNFDAMGLYTKIEERVLLPFIGDKQEVEQLKSGLWYVELYNMFFRKSKGFYNKVIVQALKGCQMILFEAYEDAGTFITSDNPSFEHKSLMVESKNSSGLVFPITPKYLLFIVKGSLNSIDIIDLRFADRETIRHFNRIVKYNSTDTIVSCEKTIDHLL